MQITPTQALADLKAANHVFLELFTHGTLSIEIYQPDKVDLQQPHERDEVYVVIAGSGTFLNGGNRSTFGPGDFLFVPAGVEHRFEDFTEDFCTWVIFYGPKGGEAGQNY
ncbi:cupin domain-containing protein [Flavilitoribacter nigricans]|uniref:Cupin n=1 Tax=Flavilitoribacter nigricans (strain ATCC 23147 / DSM 23189 / NBRC 102662 / NCIMB 1420 / SS-2) TaxID=1122177 RepID=A0A2D0NG63_FLAN2|nr:cupin domain-containing protein [Flavilitoribacter nigricans]PHN07475.1 cupin [Flavilitoribacter nigricans DSM 23189 = NBRC 102662]